MHPDGRVIVRVTTRCVGTGTEGRSLAGAKGPVPRRSDERGRGNHGVALACARSRPRSPRTFAGQVFRGCEVVTGWADACIPATRANAEGEKTLLANPAY